MNSGGMASALYEPIMGNGHLGAEPPAGSKCPWSEGQGLPHEAERHSLFRCPKESEIWPVVQYLSVVLKLVQ